MLSNDAGFPTFSKMKYIFVPKILFFYIIIISWKTCIKTRFMYLYYVIFTTTYPYFNFFRSITIGPS